jgi:hypothetical protein
MASGEDVIVDMRITALSAAERAARIWPARAISQGHYVAVNVACKGRYRPRDPNGKTMLEPNDPLCSAIGKILKAFDI